MLTRYGEQPDKVELAEYLTLLKSIVSSFATALAQNVAARQKEARLAKVEEEKRKRNERREEEAKKRASANNAKKGVAAGGGRQDEADAEDAEPGHNHGARQHEGAFGGLGPARGRGTAPEAQRLQGPDAQDD